MKIFHGEGLTEKRVAGPLYFYHGTAVSDEGNSATCRQNETTRFETARCAVQQRELLLSEKVKNRTVADLFSTRAMLLNREEPVNQSIRKLIEEKHVSAEAAVEAFFREWIPRFLQHADPAFRTKAEDLQDLKSALLLSLSRQTVTAPAPLTPSIVYAEALSPSALLLADPAQLLGLVLAEGTPLSHTVILAKSLGIPVLLHCPLPQSCAGAQALLDATEGTLTITPDHTVLTTPTAPPKPLSDLYTGVRLFAGINGLSDLPAVLSGPATGIGLFRTEYLYLTHNVAPDEEVQTAVYKQVLSALSPNPVIIRTIDLGADKLPSYLHDDQNLRGTALALKHRELFQTQLRALLRAAGCGRLFVLLPMIHNVDEVADCRTLLAKEREDLQKAGVFSEDPPLGVMIETREALDCLHALARTAAFFSVGSNDLMRSVARDRTELFEILKTIAAVARSHHIPVNLCGALASEPEMAAALIRLGYDALTLSPARLSEL